jgi:hypothetical protein
MAKQGLRLVLFCNTIEDVGSVIKTFNYESLDKHSVTRDEVLQVFESDLSFAIERGPSERGNDRAMIIGWTYYARILELGVEYFENEDREYIFHANDAGKQYKQDFERRLGYGD